MKGGPTLLATTYNKRVNKDGDGVERLNGKNR